MNDNDFFESVRKSLEKANKEVEEINENARIALIFHQEFKSHLIKRIMDAQDSKMVIINREDFITEPCNYDIRQCIDEDTINEIAITGYQYQQEQSNDESLIFTKI